MNFTWLPAPGGCLTSKGHPSQSIERPLPLFRPAMADGQQNTTSTPSMDSIKEQQEQQTRLSLGAGPHQHAGGGTDDPEDNAGNTGTLVQGVSMMGTVAKQPRFRFWVDQVLWNIGCPAVHLIEEVLVHAGGQRTGGAQGKLTPQELKDGTCLGCHHTNQWELLWTKSTYALKAVRSLRPGQCVSMVVGLNSLTMKKRMLQTLKAAYGPDAAAQLTPLSFALPEELPHWRAWLKQQARTQKDAGEQLWILKTGQDAGKGLSLLPANDAVARAECEAGRRQTEDKARFQLQIAQLYLQDPLLLEGRKFHIRLWLVVTQHEPLQAYVHSRGLVLFSSEAYDPAHPWAQPTHINTPPHGTHPTPKQRPLLLSQATPLETELSELTLTDTLEAGAKRNVTGNKSRQQQQQQRQQHQAGAEVAAPQLQSGGVQGVQGPGSSIAPGHVTNLARNSSGLVWSLRQLEQALGGPVYQQLWHAMKRSLRLTLNAARAPLAEAYQWLSPPFPTYGFQLLGVDFMVDVNMRPWLLEFNSSPSIMTMHDDPATAALIHQEKHQMLTDMFHLIAHRVYPACDHPGASHIKQCEAAPPLGEFMNLFSTTAASSSLSTSE